jgi:hypothetical protein
VSDKWQPRKKQLRKQQKQQRRSSHSSQFKTAPLGASPTGLFFFSEGDGHAIACELPHQCRLTPAPAG